MCEEERRLETAACTRNEKRAAEQGEAGGRKREEKQNDSKQARTRQQEPAHCGIVDVSRRAGRPVAGSVVLTHSSMTARGDSGVPEGLKLLVGGSTSGSAESGSATASDEPSG